MRLKDTGLTAQDIKDKVKKYMMRMAHHTLTFTQESL